MTFDPQALPTTIDSLHLGLAILAIVFFLISLFKGKATSTTTTSDSTSTTETEQPTKSAPPPTPLKDTTPESALQLLALLQQEARFIDFVQEDITAATDEEIGAVARVIHEGSKKTINEYFQLQPIRSEEEEARITLAEGFNAAEIRLTGNVVGSAPFTGTLIHRGWRATDVTLPLLAPEHDTKVIAPAEIEL